MSPTDLPPFRWRDSVGPGNEFRKSRAIERRYVAQLRSVAHHVGKLIGAFPDPLNDPGVTNQIQTLLNGYAEILQPWATAVAGRMVAEVNRQDEQAWIRSARSMSRALRREIETAPTGITLRQQLAESVVLIKSLPTEAGERVHRLTIQGMLDATRASEIAKEIARSGEVTASRSTLIARTEVARTASLLTEARCLHVGATHYRWRTAHDSQVRASHREMEGKVVAWSEAPTLSDGTVTHAGQIYNCRCYPEPIIPD